jgi:hypothetical protein
VVARARFQASFSGISKMINSPRMVAEMRRRAEKVAAQAAATAPRDTGQYSASFRVESGSHGGANRDRAYGRVSNADNAALYVELGTSRQEARHTLRDALFEAAKD